MSLLRRQLVAKAALGVFLRHGYARTTMADIAQAADLSRPTLYLTFADKDDVFRAVVERIVSTKLDAIRAGAVDLAGVDAKLDYACEVWGVQGVELVHANPNAQDVFDIRFESVREGYAAFEALLIEILSEPLTEAKLDVSASDLARVLVFGIKGFKDVARDGAEMRVMVRALTTVVSAALRPSPVKIPPAPKKKTVRGKPKSRA